MGKESIKVSVYRNSRDNIGKIITLDKWLEGYEPYNKLVDQIRLEPDKEIRSELKKGLPAITPAGTFSRRNDKNLINHSGFMALDFDHLFDPETAKQYLARLDFIYYCGLSASGSGLWALIPIKHTQHHKRVYDALEADFAQVGLITDPKCKNVSRLRFYSYDPYPIINLQAVIYDKIAPENEQPVFEPSEQSGGNETALDFLINRIESTQTDITTDYHDWFKIGGTLASIFGEDGRNRFHRISQFYPGYDKMKTDEQFNICLRHIPGFTENMIFSIARNYNLMLKNA